MDEVCIKWLLRWQCDVLYGVGVFKRIKQIVVEFGIVFGIVDGYIVEVVCILGVIDCGEVVWWVIFYDVGWYQVEIVFGNVVFGKLGG